MAGDSLYMRAMFDRDQEQDGELSFRKDDILFVDNTMYQGKRGTWRAWLVDDEGSKLRCGTIPSKARSVGSPAVAAQQGGKRYIRRQRRRRVCHEALQELSNKQCFSL